MALVELGRFNRNEANIIIGLLDSQGIDAIAFDGNASIADGSYLMIPVRVMVDDDDLGRARDVIAGATDPAGG
jgi:hypothetical protein